LVDVAARISSLGEGAIERLEAINGARERALAETRQIVRLSANATRATHRGEFEQSKELLSKARELLDGLSDLLGDYPSIYWSGYVQDSQKEYAEASITLGVISRGGIDGPVELNVEQAVYLNGMGEAAGEFRRYALDCIRRADIDEAVRVLGVMDEIYGVLVSVDFPDAITGGLRRTADMVRGVLERTRGDLTMALQQRKLTEALGRAEELVRTIGDGSESEPSPDQHSS